MQVPTDRLRRNAIPYLGVALALPTNRLEVPDR